ncbi:coiled-coil domain-containing protein 91 isoform X5 [Oxyura jamaicensis]|uniref:coiled-coil domain-containing protein 91 isoform X5 n=1 Tax=Oxyura jamaicensis TaxID=8884 RepID=UPI0015A6F9DC|nr:coiled-coil domain-containing protein 91 isoform X5 [Oxyura jamaicensis]
MDDDDFGGFEAAESYECGNGEKQTTSPAISWAAFPTVSEVHISRNVSPDVLLKHSVPSSCLVPPDSFTLSNDNVATAIQTANIINPAVLNEQNQVDIQVASLNLNEDISLVTSAIGTDDNETKRKNELKSCLQQTVANLETKLCTAEEEKIKTKQELEYLLEKNSILEMNFLTEKKEKLLKYQDHYKMIQEKHKQELEDMRQAGHEALSIIVEEFKALLQSTVQQQEAAVEKQYILAIEKQSHKCEELLNAQHQRLLDILEAEKEVLSEKIEEALMQQSQKHKEMLDKCLDEERERSKEAVAAAMKEIVKEALMEEQKRSEKAVEEAVKRTREELVEYIKEQKRLDQVVRQRNLSSLELFLSCAQKQLSILLNEDPTTTEEKRD